MSCRPAALRRNGTSLTLTSALPIIGIPAAASAVMLPRNTRRFMPSLLPRDFRPGDFALRTLRAFRANQGLLLAGAVAYYALLSIVPLLILCLIGLSHVIERSLLLDTLERYLGWLLP